MLVPPSKAKATVSPSVAFAPHVRLIPVMQ
jgi:hypothetical protein